MNPRRCVACRKQQVTDRLSRVVRRPDGTVVLQGEGKIDGRGAYLCHDSRCFVLAKKKGLLSKALGVDVPEEIFDQLAKSRDVSDVAESDDLGALLGLCRRAGDLVIGQDRVSEALKLDSNYLLLYASDCPEKLIKKTQSGAARWAVLLQNRQELGGYLGIKSVVMVALATSSGFARKVLKLLPKGGIELEETTRL